MVRLRLNVILVCALSVTQALPAQVPPEIVQAIDAVETRFERALAQRDRSALEAIVATPFTWVHASDGRVEPRDVWLAVAAQGMALTGQRLIRTEHGPALTAYGTPQPHTVVRIARVQLVDSGGTRESWLRQTHIFVRSDDGGWRIASGQGTLMYDGPRLDPALHARYAGTYDIPGGRVLSLTWEDGALFAKLPNGAIAQIFLGSPTDEVVRTIGSGRLRFTLGQDGSPVTAALVRGDVEVWRGTKRVP